MDIEKVIKVCTGVILAGVTLALVHNRRCVFPKITVVKKKS